MRGGREERAANRQARHYCQVADLNATSSKNSQKTNLSTENMLRVYRRKQWKVAVIIIGHKIQKNMLFTPNIMKRLYINPVHFYCRYRYCIEPKIRQRKFPQTGNIFCQFYVKIFPRPGNSVYTIGFGLHSLTNSPSPSGGGRVRQLQNRKGGGGGVRG